MAFHELKFPKYLPDFPSHSKVLQYLQDYSEHHFLHELIKFNSPVESIARNGSKWVVDDSEEYDAVVVANGHYDEIKRLPIDVDGGFHGKIIHSKFWDRNDDFAGKTVLVAGGGSSGKDIAESLSEVCRMVFWSPSRSKVDESLMLYIPEENRDRMQFCKRIDTINQHGVMISGDQPINEENRLDAIINACGYKFTAPFIEDLAPEIDIKKNTISVDLGCFSQEYPTSLFFPGQHLDSLFFPHVEQQVQAIALAIRMGEDEYSANYQEKVRSLKLPYSFEHDHKIVVNRAVYMQLLREFCKDDVNQFSDFLNKDMSDKKNILDEDLLQIDKVCFFFPRDLYCKTCMNRLNKNNFEFAQVYLQLKDLKTKLGRDYRNLEGYDEKLNLVGLHKMQATK